MREVKFRGKTLKGEWVYGYYVFDYSKNEHFIFTNELGAYNAGFKPRREDYSLGYELIDPATVGQYTGLKDKYRCEIYEGDILETFDQGQIRQLWYVRFEQGCFIAALDNLPNYIQPFVRVDFAQVEVIGNIHDNPDLLEVRP